MIKQRGFTIVEVLVTVPIFIVSSAIMVSVLTVLYLDLVKKNADIQLRNEANTVLMAIQDEMYFTRNFAPSAQDAMVDTSSPVTQTSDWQISTDTADLILYAVAIDTPRQSSSRQVVYQKTEASGYSCEADYINLNPPVLTNLIYYVDSQNNLRRRVLIPDPVNERCAEPYLVQTCDIGTTRVRQTLTGTETVDCPADITLASGVQDFTVTYYDEDDNVLDVYDGDSPFQAEKIRLDLTLARTIMADEYTYSTNLTVAKINGGDPNIQ